MPFAEKVAAMLEALTIADVEALPPARRRQLADLCRHWAKLAEPPAADTAPAGTDAAASN